jgi:hypothetical protein
VSTIADIGVNIHGTKPVTFYLSPTHVATLARAIQIPGSAERRYLYLLLVWRRVAGGPGPDAPCLVVSSETIGASPEYVLGVYGDTGHQILASDHGDWADISAFAVKAISLASGRLNTKFVERVPSEQHEP